jgi:hypothetical protein
VRRLSGPSAGGSAKTCQSPKNQQNAGWLGNGSDGSRYVNIVDREIQKTTEADDVDVQV